MNVDGYRKKRRRDPEYRRVERRLKPWLYLVDLWFRMRMRLARRWSGFCIIIGKDDDEVWE